MLRILRLEVDAMTLRQLRREHSHACKMARLYPGLGWRKTVARLNREIMAALVKRAA